MTEVESMALAIAFGICLGFSIKRQRILQRHASSRKHRVGLFTRFTQAVASGTFLIAALFTAWGINSVSFEGFMSLTLAIATGLLLTGRRLGDSLSR